MAAFDHLTEAERIAETLGVVLGAASQCEQVTEERLNSVAVKARHALLARANDDADAEAADERFSAALEAGRTAAESGRIDPESVELALSELEEQLSA
jgi:thiazole synthase ThiGH ThiG subunit